ncbi:MAG: hypothetical protein A3E31_04980 [Candidatus Rokubacteria bacterium RIFCSPHIGHO2_12_FULL_73_22]|nr:MAG: hypothetical protein A3E31_04980 [Candidatus Rokubacteria bacterium RIFCSPHIGHO2_12_FULL_73_22]OGL26268.1 MAG: hypothetical protein A3G44_13230 [Candidatus Rokubacteria bacterium RIFCSPLOWO2_12_FULL_73_47]
MTMRTLTCKSTTVWGLLGLAFLIVLLAGPAPAQARRSLPDAVLYEATEDMYLLDAAGNPTGDLSAAVARYATSALSGSAEFGSPLCPVEFLVVYPKAKRCAVNARGQNLISLVDGTGPFWGDFVVVIQGDNPTDAPEAVVGVGAFQGQGSLAPVFQGVPLGSLAAQGTVSFPALGIVNSPFSFSGTFRLPFSVAKDGSHERAWVNRGAFYLNDQNKKSPVRHNERSLGWPTVRLDVEFQ